jgi:predicted AAA+ superfamily ATPase
MKRHCWTSDILFLLHPYHRNFNKRLVKSPKLCFYDSGLVSSLLGINQYKHLESHYLRGSLFENMIIADIYKSFTNIGKEPPISFWRDKTGHEIDLFIESGNELFPVEIKSGLTIYSDFFKNLKYFHDLSGLPASQSSLIYGGDKDQKCHDIQIRSWQKMKLQF